MKIRKYKDEFGFTLEMSVVDNRIELSIEDPDNEASFGLSHEDAVDLRDQLSDFIREIENTQSNGRK
jgi:hypothetical protein